MPQRAKPLIILAAIAAIAVLVLYNTPSHAPVRPGTASEFWMAACGINIDGKTPQIDTMGSGTYPPQGNSAIYYIQGIHDQILFRVPLAELVPQLPKFETELRRKQKDEEHTVFLDHLASNWQLEATNEDEVRRLHNAMREALIAVAETRDAKDGEHNDRQAWMREREDEFMERWRRAQRYWLTVLFEFAWLSIVVLFAAWPWLRSRSELVWAAHLGLSLPLLFVPFFLGYVPFTFTSLFPDGGVYYPYVIMRFRGLPSFDADAWLLQHAPQPFEFLNQGTGPPLAITGLGFVGPIAISIAGLFVSAGTYVLAVAWRAMCRLRFPQH